MPYADPARQREYQAKWVARRRAEWFEDKSCVECGSTSNLELHHLDPEQKVSHRIWSWSQARRETELAKCVPLCARCHAEESAHQLPLKIPREVIEEIRARYAAGEAGTSIKDDLGLGNGYVYRVIRGTARTRR